MSSLIFSEADILSMLDTAYEGMDTKQRRFWNEVRISPEVWKHNEYGNFWAVGLTEKTVIWFNDIEEGFNRPAYTRNGIIDEYFCDQDELEWAVQKILDAVGE